MRNLAPMICVLILLCSCGSRTELQLTQAAILPTASLTNIPATSFPAKTPSVTETRRLADQDYQDARERMLLRGIKGWGIEDSEVIEVMGIVPRHEFVPEQYLDQAYENYPLPIGYGQTISQPYIVALMTQELGVSQGDRVLEVGTGSGYQAAVLAQLGVEVYTVEIIGPLAELATERFEKLGYSQITSKHDDGYYGWEEESPFDAIIVTAAPDHVPQPLLAQLKVGGIMVIPVGPIGGIQELWRITRLDEDSYQSSSLGGVRFVPLTRIDESQDEAK
jgi:protein-L-isoaspartate(D-aspartate) O-methyltransferase